MTCNHCTPDRYGKRMPLDIDEFPIGEYRIKRNTLKIYRKRKGHKKRHYFIGCHSLDLSDDREAMFRNNGFLFYKVISFCPMCGRDLRQVIK